MILNLTGTATYPLVERTSIGRARYYQPRGAEQVLVLNPGPPRPTLTLLGFPRLSLCRIDLRERTRPTVEVTLPDGTVFGFIVDLLACPETDPERRVAWRWRKHAEMQAFLDCWLTWGITGVFESGGFLMLEGGFDDPRDTQDRPE